ASPGQEPITPVGQVLRDRLALRLCAALVLRVNDPALAEFYVRLDLAGQLLRGRPVRATFEDATNPALIGVRYVPRCIFPPSVALVDARHRLFPTWSCASP